MDNRKEEAIPLITINHNTKQYELNPTAFKFIEELSSPIAVIGVTSHHRTGKAYLLNKVILNQNFGFGMGASFNPCTKGIWIWPKSLKAQTSDGKIVNLIVIDSEGIGSTDQDNYSDDSNIFALVLMISSMFIYNSVGAIDDTSLSNQSILSNIVNHIHIKDSSNSSKNIDHNNSEENDFENLVEKYKKYFPNFLWILRDFSLQQLVDENGIEITTKQYLENALAPEKGFSNKAKENNKIRFLLKNFFGQRNCYTMLRPLMDENNPDSKTMAPISSPRKLRPEFVDQMFELRKQIFNTAEPKVLKGKVLNGQMLCSLIQQYITSINSSMVPNIDQAWDFICKNHSKEVYEDCVRLYEESIHTRLSDNFPLSKDTLKLIHCELAEECMDKMTKEAMGEFFISKFKSELGKTLQNKYISQKYSNRKEFEKILLQSLNNYYISNILEKLKTGEIKTFGDYEKDMRKTRAVFMDLEPKGPNKLNIINEFILSKGNESTCLLINNSKEDQLNTINHQKEDIKKTEQNLYDNTETTVKEKNEFLLNQLAVENEKHELEAKNQILELRVNDIKAEVVNYESEKLQKLQEEKENWLKQKLTFEKKIEELQDQQKLSNKNVMMLNFENQKEVALLNQKYAFYENLQEQWQKKEKELNDLMELNKKSVNQQAIDLSNKYENQIKCYEEQLEDLNNKYTETLGELDKNDVILKKYEQDNQKLKNQIHNKDLKVGDLQEQVRRSSVVRPITNADNDEILEHDIVKQLQQSYNDKIEKTRQSFREKDDTIKNIAIAFDKERAVLTQNVQFYEIQVSDLKKQLLDTKRIHDNALKLFEETSENRYGMNQQILDLKDTYNNKFKKIQIEYEGQLESANNKINEQTESKDELENENKELADKSSTQVSDLQSRIEKLVMKVRKVQEENQALTTEKNENAQIFDKQKIAKVMSLEKEIKIVRRSSVMDMSNYKKTCEESLIELKDYYEKERERLNKKIDDEKERYDRNLNETIEEYEALLEKERLNEKETIIQLEEEVKELNLKGLYNKRVYEEELNNKQQNLSLMEQSQEDTKQMLGKIQGSTTSNLKDLIVKFEAERNELLSKIDSKNNLLSEKEIRMFQIEQQLKEFQGNEHKKITNLENLKIKNEEEISNLRNELNNQSEEIMKKNDDLLYKENNQQKEVALSNQKVELFQRRIDDLNKNISMLQRDNQDRILNENNLSHLEMKEAYMRLESEKDNLRMKYEKKQSKLKEIQIGYNSQVLSLQTEVAMDKENQHEAEQKIITLKKKLEVLNQDKKDQMKKIKDKYKTEKEFQKSQAEKGRLQSYEQELSQVEAQAIYDKDMALWRGKHDFQMQQKEQFKCELNETQKNFEIMLSKFRQCKKIEQTESEANQMEIIGEIEQKYEQLIRQLNAQHESVINEYAEKLKLLDQENQQLACKAISTPPKKDEESIYYQKYLTQLEEIKKLENEILMTQKDSDREVLELKISLNKEKENYTMRYMEFENNLSEFANKNGRLKFELEKYQTRARTEKDMLITRHNEMQERYDNLMKKNDEICEENNKLKSDFKYLKKFSSNTNMVNYNSTLNIMDIAKGKKKGDWIKNQRVSSDESGLYPKTSRNFYSPNAFK